MMIVRVSLLVLILAKPAIAEQVMLTCNRVNDISFPQVFLSIDTDTWNAERVDPSANLVLISLEEKHAAWISETRENHQGFEEYATRTYLLNRETMNLMVATASIFVMDRALKTNNMTANLHIFQCSRPL
jgi:hypothetical protein